MHGILSISLGVLGVFVFYKFVHFISNEVFHWRKARRLGCKPPPWLMTQDPLGIRNIRRISASDREFRVPHYLQNVTTEAVEKHNTHTFRQSILGARFLYTVDPKITQAILATQFKDFGLGASRYGNFGALLGDGIFSTDGKKWEHSRALLRPQFAREQVSDLELEERHVQNLLRALPTGKDGWTEVTDLKPLFFRLTFDASTEFLFGQSVESQLLTLPGQAPSESTADLLQFSRAVDDAQMGLANSFRLGDMYWLAHNAEFKENCRRCHAFVDKYVEQALSRSKSGEKKTNASGKPAYVFLDALAESTSNPLELRNETLSILIAGRDTTAGMLCFLFMLFEMNPHVYKKLREIILEEFGTYKNPRDITFARLKSCNYLQWCMHETLRLYPIVPFDSRRALKDTILPTGGGPDGNSPVYIREGTQVDYGLYPMHRRKDLWGPDAEEFRPERWEKRRMDWSYVPFNGGPRTCIGQQFALTEAGYVTTRLLQRFEIMEGGGNTWDPVEEGGLGWIRLWVTLTMSPKDGVKVRFKETAE